MESNRRKTLPSTCGHTCKHTRVRVHIPTYSTHTRVHVHPPILTSTYITHTCVCRCTHLHWQVHTAHSTQANTPKYFFIGEWLNPGHMDVESTESRATVGSFKLVSNRQLQTYLSAAVLCKGNKRNQTPWLIMTTLRLREISSGCVLLLTDLPAE